MSTVKTIIFSAGSVAMCTAVLSIAAPAVAAPQVGIASVQSIQYSNTGASTRVTITLDGEASYRNARLTGPDRVYFDISNTTLRPEFSFRTISVGGEFLKQIRANQNRPDVVRVVLDVSGTGDYSVSELHDPFRIVILLHERMENGTGRNPPQPAPAPRVAEHHRDVALKPMPDASAAAQQVRKPPTVPAVDQDPPQNHLAVPTTQSPLEASARDNPSMPEEDPPPSPGQEVASTDSPAATQNAHAPSRTVRHRARKAAAPTSDGRPLTVTGTFTSGFYSSFTRGGGNENQEIRFVPAGATFDINGYFMTPDLLNYSVQPELNASAQASDAGFIGGNGVRMRVTALRRQAFPVTFRYSNVQLTDVYFGSLTQVSSFTQKNRNTDMGVTAEFKLRGFPAATIDWGTSTLVSQSGIDMVPNYNSRSKHINIECADQRWGWDFGCYISRQQQVSDLLIPQSENSSSPVLLQKSTQYQFSARRSLLQDSELYMDAGSQSTSSVVAAQPIDLTTRYANANLRLFQRRRWKTSLRSGYTSNLSGLLLKRLIEGLSGDGAVAPQWDILAPFRHTLSYLNIGDYSSVDLWRGFTLFGSLDWNSVLRSSDSSLHSKYFTADGGVSYSGSSSWGSFSGEYGRSFGTGLVTGQSGRIEGQHYVVSAQPGNWDLVQFDLTVRGTDRSVINEHPAREHSLAPEGSVGFRVLAGFRARLGGGWQQSTFTNSGNDFNTWGYIARGGIEHSRFQLSGSLRSIVGNSLQAYGGLFNILGMESAALGTLRIVPSDSRGITVTLHAVPMRKLELSGSWTRSVQHLEGMVANDFDIIDAYAIYHFRKLQLQAGFFRSTQIYTSYLATYPETQRGRYYIRISRTARFL